MNTSVVRTQKVLRGRIGEIQPFLSVDEPFTIRDIEDTGGKRPCDVLKLMHHNGAVEKVDTEFNNGHHIGKWKWKQEEKEELVEWLEEQSLFPKCGHKVSVYNPEWADELACRVCQTEYTKEQVKEWL